MWDGEFEGRQLVLGTLALALAATATAVLAQTPAKQPPQPAMQSIEDLEVCLQLDGELRTLQEQCLGISLQIDTRREANRERALDK